jgi:hypothetical protein
MGLLRMQIAAASTSSVTYTVPITLPTGWNDPVVVHPNSAQINAATEEINDEAATATNCSICQDSLSASHIRLVHCGHTFHNTCIAEWFTRSVHCPMCRHDVREVGHPAPTSADPIHTPPRVRNRLDAWLVGAHPMSRTEETEESDEHHA